MGLSGVRPWTSGGTVVRREKLGARANMGTVPAVSPGTQETEGLSPCSAGINHKAIFVFISHNLLQGNSRVLPETIKE